MKCLGLLWMLLALLLTSATPALSQTDDEDCMSCHGNAKEVKEVLDLKPLRKSVHEDLECIDCHETITERQHPEQLPKVHCAGCHEDEGEEFKESVHALAKIDDPRFQPSCSSCHGAHDMPKKKDKSSRINHDNISKTCGECHSKPEVISRFGARALDPVAMYEKSVHAQALHKDPKKKSATCTDCHSSHRIYAPLHPESTFSKFNIPKTCGKCHEDISKEYLESVHWQAVQNGHYESPVCYDCHGEHGVQLTAKGKDGALESTKLCANCHANSVLMTRFGLDAGRFSSYMETYHGLAVMRGSPDAAKCVSCHETHAIRSTADPLSTTYESNLGKTCGTCHPGASGDFLKVPAHPSNLRERNPVAYLFRTAYVWIIALTIGGMLLHNGIIFTYYMRRHWQQHRAAGHAPRFSTFQVVQHLLLFLSFTTLAVTGFALKHPDAGWTKLLGVLGMNEVVRGVVHRGAAVVLVAVSILQGIYFVLHRSGRREIFALIPRWSDFVGLWKTMRFYLGFSRERYVEKGRYDYTEKFEYLALIWGTMVMAFTGFVLWFPQQFLVWLPTWVFGASEVIHYYEAILAVLAVVVWHFFFTIFHPEKYPMNLTWIDGKAPSHHPEDSENEEDLDGSKS